jgi:uncharacterized membrane protein
MKCLPITCGQHDAPTLKHWPVQITIADLCWGTVLSATAATLGFLIASYLSAEV